MTDEYMPEALRFHKLLNYNSETGVFTWKERSHYEFKHKHQCVSWNNRCAGKVAGSVVSKKNKKYLVFSVDNKRVYAHRAAWLMEYGSFPSKEIDHINGDSTDNSIRNLRETSRGDNCRNMRRHRKSKSGITGVSLHKKTGKWRARVTFDGKEYFCGLYDDLDDAAKAVKEKRNEFGFHDNHGGDPLKTKDEIEREETIGYMASDIADMFGADYRDAEKLYNANYRRLKENEVIVKPLSDEQRQSIYNLPQSSNIRMIIDAVQREQGVIE